MSCWRAWRTRGRMGMRMDGWTWDAFRLEEGGKGVPPRGRAACGKPEPRPYLMGDFEGARQETRTSPVMSVPRWRRGV